MVESKTCPKCGETKPVSEFPKRRASPDGLNTYCKTCSNSISKEFHRKRPFYQTFNGARKRARARDLPFSITEEYLESIWTGVCPVFQVRLEVPLHGAGHTVTTTRPSLDRLVPDKGYVPGNVIWISFRANTIKSDANSEEVQAVATWLKQTEEEIAKHEAD